MGVPTLDRNPHEKDFMEYMEIILKSGLLLDEDSEAVQTEFNFNSENHRKYGTRLNFSTIFMGGCLLTSALFTSKTNNRWIIGICSSITLVVLSPKIRFYYNQIQFKCNLNHLIDHLRSILILNRRIGEYYKLRKSNDGATTYAYTKQVEDLSKTIEDNEISVMDELRTSIGCYSNLRPILMDQFNYLNQIDFKTFVNHQINSIDDCLTHHYKVNDVFILISSNYLACLALSDFSNDIILKSVTKLRKSSQFCLANIRNKYHETSYRLIRSKSAKIRVRDLKINTQSTLHKSLMNSMAQSEIILERSQMVFEKLQKLNRDDRIQGLGEELRELRDKAHDYYQSLDVLHKLYEITVNPPAKSLNVRFGGEEDVSDDDEPICTKSPSDGVDEIELNSEDEEYEGYVGEHENPSKPDSYNYEDEDESLKFASLMTQELKQSLKHHCRFLKAREKRGIVDEAFHKKETKNKVVNQTDVKLETVSNSESIPPPPPPLAVQATDNLPTITAPAPRFHTFAEENREISMFQESSFLQTLKEASSARKIVEDVFGDDD